MSFLLLLHILKFEKKIKVDLRITNDLGTGADLNLHCQSKDDDFGTHVMAPDQFFEFRFRPKFLGTT